MMIQIEWVYSYIYTAVRSEKAVSAYFTSEQILLFGFAEQYNKYVFSHHSDNIDISHDVWVFMTDEVTVYLTQTLEKCYP